MVFWNIAYMTHSKKEIEKNVARRILSFFRKIKLWKLTVVSTRSKLVAMRIVTSAIVPESCGFVGAGIIPVPLKSPAVEETKMK